MAATQSTAAIRSYRIYLRDATNALARPHDVDLASDNEARELAVRMLDEQVNYPCVEVWDRTRLVCTVRRDDYDPPRIRHSLAIPLNSTPCRSRILPPSRVRVRRLGVLLLPALRKYREGQCPRHLWLRNHHRH